MGIKAFLVFKPPIYLLWVVYIASGFAISNANADNCPQNIIAYWRLGETSQPYLDSVASHNGTCTACPTGDSSGAIDGDGAESFDSVDDGISVSANAAFDWSESDSFSMELWMKRSDTGYDEVMIARKDSTNQTLWMLEILAEGRARFTLQASNGDSAVVTGTKILDNNAWHHVAAVRKRGTSDEVMLYVDGELDNQVTGSFGAGFGATADLTIGWIDDTDPKRFGGVLDEIAVYGGALNEVDVRAHYFLSRPYCELRENAVRIMPLGDSITDDDTIDEGTSGNSYRKPLWEDLNNSRFWVDFVGSRHNQTSDFDNDHEGHAGYTDTQIAANVQSYLTTNPADVILLHIGTNQLDTGPGDVENLLNNIDSFNNGKGVRITVILARIIDRIPANEGTTTQFNDNVQQMVQTRILNGDKIVLVDMEDGAGLLYDYTINGGDFVDYLHPHDSGYVKMADQWYTKLDSFLPMVETPQFTSSPITNAITGVDYSYDVAATGNPTPKYSLTTSPEGMTIDESSGVIQWTPSAAGDQDVVVQAQNVGAQWGINTQSFTISVSDNNPPQIISSAPSTATVGTVYTYNPTATDSDGDTLVWSMVSGPPAMSIDFDTGAVTWTPVAGDIGTSYCSIKVSDENGGESSQRFEISVNNTKNDIGGSSDGGGGGCFIQSLF